MLPPGKIVDERCYTIENLQLQYALYEDKLDGRAAFSVGVTLYDSSDGHSEREAVFDITSLRENADEIFRAISDGAVTPMTLGEVIYDLLP